jgi:signal transduction histidine kinase
VGGLQHQRRPQLAADGPLALQPRRRRTWLIWLITAGALSLAGAAAIARLINRPLKQLSYAANRVRDGDFAASHLDEEVVTSEIREVNIGFNRMAQKLAKLEQDRAVMLAGISHDLRTPLARLRLETEMSVMDEIAREHMVADIVQLDATIDKFLDYARPDHVTLTPVNLHAVVSSCVYAVQDHRELQITMHIPEDLNVLADEVELARVISNLLENARRYGKTADTGVTSVDIAAKARENWVLLKLRDHGTGVPPEQLANLTKPFFRGDSARTAAAGAGLGLSIVDKTVQRMGGIFALANSSTGGLVAHIQLQRASEPCPRAWTPSSACSARPSSATCPASGLEQQHHGTRLHGQPLPHRAQALGGLGLDVHLIRLHTQCLRNAGAHGRNVRCQARRLGHHGAVDVANLVARRAHPAGCLSQQHGRIRATEGATSVSGKCVPMSPRPAAPSRASVMACSSTSASE